MAAAETKREAFRQYLDTTGLSDSLNRVISKLYDLFVQGDERPDPLDYIKQHLGRPDGYNAEGLRDENKELRRRGARAADPRARMTCASAIDKQTPQNFAPLAGAAPAPKPSAKAAGRLRAAPFETARAVWQIGVCGRVAPRWDLNERRSYPPQA
jgi:hypothetical protein